MRNDHSKGRAPFKVLYSNDTTNIMTCVSPFHKRGEDMTTEMLLATVDEVADVDVNIIEPGYCWIPWWKSKIYPVAEHVRWWEQSTGLKWPDVLDTSGDDKLAVHLDMLKYFNYILDGNDLIQIFMDRCRQHGQTPFVSFRLNDSHFLEHAGTKDPQGIYVPRFYAEHPEFRLGPSDSWEDRVQNWAIPEVREHKFALIRELCENYDMDGLVLDFMRHDSYFRLTETTHRQRCEIMTDFVARVREVLDRTSRGGKHRWLCARVPCLLCEHDSLGIDLPAMAEAGVEMVSLSGMIVSIQQNDLWAVRKMVPGVAVYQEMIYTTMRGIDPHRDLYDGFYYPRMTDNQYYTGANLAYARGADGVSLFNFPYFREHGPKDRGPFNEPPFHILKHLGEPEWLRKQDQWYVLAKDWENKIMGDRPLPKTLYKGDKHSFLLDFAPESQRQTKSLFRLRSLGDASKCVWNIRINGVQLKPTDYIAKPIEHPYDAFLGEPENYACFECPPKVIFDGLNQVTLTLEQGDATTVVYMDLIAKA